MNHGSVLPPQHIKRERMCLKRWRRHSIHVSKRCCNRPTSVCRELEDFQCAQYGVDIPSVLNFEGAIDSKLARAIQASRRGRQHLAHPIWRRFEIGRRRHVRQPLPSPAHDIRDNDVRTEMQLWLVQQNPAARTAATTIERVREFATEAARCASVFWRRPWVSIQHAVHNLTDHVFRQCFDFPVSRGFHKWLGHDTPLLWILVHTGMSRNRIHPPIAGRRPLRETPA
jgi:hypothetical protein